MAVPGRRSGRGPAISIVGLSILVVLLVVDWNVIDLLTEVSRFTSTVSSRMIDRARTILRSLAAAIPPMASLVAFAAGRGAWELGRTGRCPPFITGFVVLGMVAMGGTVAVAAVTDVEFTRVLWGWLFSGVLYSYHRRWFYRATQLFFSRDDLVLPVFHGLSIVALLAPQLAVAVLGGVCNERWLGLTLVLERRRPGVAVGEEPGRLPGA